MSEHYICNCGIHNDSNRPAVIEQPVILHDTPENIEWDRIREEFENNHEYYEDAFSWLKKNYRNPPTQ